MEHYWHLGKWAGIPVSMHWSVLLAFPWLFLFSNSLVFALIGTVAFMVLLATHELGHVLVAKWRGIYVQDITLFSLHGTTTVGLKRSAVDEVLIAWGGVAAQLVLLLLTTGAKVLVLTSALQNPWLLMLTSPILEVFTYWNVFLMIVALLPIGPMDGHLAWKAIPLLRRSLSGLTQPKAPEPVEVPGSKVVYLTAAKRRELEKKAEIAAAQVIRDLGKNK